MDNDGFFFFIAILSFGVFGLVAGWFVADTHYKRLLIEKYGATYCDGEFSLEGCDE